ncbi:MULTISPECIES: molybdenum cofactor biosynthesis protein MoaE [Rubrivirga]|uniref:molybdenum cofactor biosynthesis protein MoaE n=1 Tax=Rubrivirga TaxID=1434037 RepID=UPI0032C20E0A
MATEPIDPAELRRALAADAAGAFVAFEGWVRDHNGGRAVTALEYEAYTVLAVSEGENVLAEAAERFDVEAVRAVHRTGRLAIGELAVWVGVSAAHRGPAFEACRYVIDEVKARVPIWKREHYADGAAGWVDGLTGAPGPTSPAPDESEGPPR